MKRLLLCVVIVSFLGMRAHAATYYISTTGSDSGNGSSGQPWATFDHAWTVMHSCDTLIVNDGLYMQTVSPSATLNGNSGCYTTIQAAHDWGATVDGSTTGRVDRGTLNLESVSYFLVRGIKFAGNPAAYGPTNPTVGGEALTLLYSDHIKLDKVAAYNAPCYDNVASFDMGPGNSYVLVEDSHTWGCGRYKFLVYQSSNVIVRHSVARHDYHDVAGWPGSISGWGRQCAQFTMYDSTNVLFQNDIDIDSGVADMSTGELWGGIWSENNGGVNNSGKYEGMMFINVVNSFNGASIADYKLDGATREVVNTAIVNSLAGYIGGSLAGTNNLLLHHMTVANLSGSHNTGGSADGIAAVVTDTSFSQELFEDSIVQHMIDFGLGGYIKSDYNLFYNNPANFGADWYQAPVPTAGAHDIQGTNPQLKYVTRVEAGTPGKGTASDGGDRGATILYRIGTPGTMWGETGYDALTSTPLWPWDDEAVIKSDMAGFSMVNPVAGGTISGARGFAAPGNGLYGGPITLTSYVWEQLGYPCPGDCKTASAFLPSGGGGTNYTLTVNAPTGGTISGTNCNSGSYPSGTNVSCTATPNSGSTFADWSGGTCSGTTSPCTFTLSGNDTVTATFNASGTNYNLTVSKTGTGSGTISGANCTSASYASGTSVTCHGAASAGSTFAGWSGRGSASVCSGTSDCSFSVTATSTVTGTFNTSGGALTLGRGTCSASMTGTQYAAFSGCTLAASGGTPPYTYSWKAVTDGSYAALPEGLSVNSSTGAISGTVYGQGSYVPQFMVSDSASASATLSTITFSLTGDNTLGGCSLFPSDSIFHQRVDSLAVDNSPAASIPSSYQSSTIKPFFGGAANGSLPNGIPMIRVPYNQANVSISTTQYQSYFTSGPFPSYAPVEDTSNYSGADRHVLVIQTAGGGNPCRLWEMWQGAVQTNGSWTDSSNAYWSNIGSTGTGAYAMLPQDNGSTDAAGLPIAPLLVTADDVIGTGTPSAPNGSVQHPIRFTLSSTLGKYVWPATDQAGSGSCSGGYEDGNNMLLQGSGAPTSCTTTAPMGEIYRLKSTVATPSCAASSPQAAIIIQGLRQYGIILADNGSSGGLIGTPDARWNDNDLACLRQLTLANFEPVDVSSTAKTVTANYNGSGFSAPVTSYQTTSSGAPTLTGITVTPPTSSIAAGTGTQQYAAQCAYSNNTTSDCTSAVTWSSSNTAVAAISSGGLASGVAAGSSTITATSGGISGTAALTVTAAGGTLAGITVTPATASIVAGTGTQQYAAQCNYSNNTTSNCTATVTWSSSNTAVATITAGGLATGVAAGTPTIKAASGTVSGSAVLTVTTATLTGITVTPATASIVAGTGTQQYAAQCSYSNNTTSYCTATVTWSSSNTAAATISGAGLATGVAAGTSTIKATSGSVSGTAVLTVTTATLTGITVTPATASIVAGTGTQQYAAQCNYSNNTTSNCTATVTWSSSNTAVATITAGGLATGVAAGTPTIKAASGTVSGSAVLTVIKASLTGITVTPATASIVAGTGTQQYVAQCSYSATNNSDCTATVTWSSSNTAVATVAAGGLASGVMAGTATIKATYGSISGSAFLTVSAPPVNQTNGSWAWMGGSNTVPAGNTGRPGIYNALGTFSPGNIPGSRTASVGWTDSSGNLWMFGGDGFDSAGVDGYLNDLWEYLPATEEWAWMDGSSTVPAANQGWPGVYGTLGTPLAGNSPGSRKSSVSWTDKAGNFWLFGGIGYDSAGTNGSLNDLWEFNPSTQEWAWMGGGSTVPAANQGSPGVYGQLGVADAANIPGGRSGANRWTDASGNLWLFGGVGYDSLGSLGSLNDLWQLDPSDDKWTWMGGSKTVGSGGGQMGVYGPLGDSATTNVPSGRSSAVTWADNHGNFWLFGGRGYDSTGTLGYLNDLWEFDPTTRRWAWVGVSNSVGCADCGRPGSYGTQSNVDSANIPGGRTQAAGWTDSNGNLWLLGGNGYDSAGTLGILNDLWEFLPSTMEWAWMGGSSTVPGANQGPPGTYGQLGVPDAGNTPGGRWATSGWTDSNGNLWLLGGSGDDASGANGILNDLWVYQPSPGSLPAATPNFSIGSGTYNAVQNVAIADVTPEATIYYTTDGTTPGTNSNVYSGPITVSSSMTIKAIAAAKDYKTSNVASSTYTITPAFTIAPRAGSPTTVSVQPGGAATFNLVVTPVGSATLIAPVTLTATGLPPGSTGTFNPKSLTAGVGASDVSLSIQTTTTSASMVSTGSKWTLALCMLFFPLLLRRWRCLGKQLSLTARLIAGVLVLAGTALALTGCAGVVLKNNESGSTPTAYTITVTAATGQVQKTTTVTLSVQ